MTTKRPALDRAVERLRRLVASQPEGTTLPGIRKLARRFRVSHVTMWKAVQVLKQQGVVCCAAAGTVAGSAAEVAESEPGPAPPTPPPPRLPRWQEVQRQLAQDILALRYPPGSRLPATRVLARRHAAAPVNVRRALRALVDDGRLAPSGRGYRVSTPRPSKALGRVVFLGRSRRGDLLSDLAPRSLELWRALETNCRRFDLRLQTHVVEDDLERLSRRAGLGESGVVGYVVRNLEIESQQGDRLLASLLATGKPVSVIDELGMASHLRQPGRSRRLRVFSVANSTRAAHEVGEHLLALGHRRVAFFSPYDQAGWSKKRLEGLTRAFALAGLEEAVQPFVLESFGDDWGLREAIHRSRGYQAWCRGLVEFSGKLNPLSEISETSFHRQPQFQLVLGEFLTGCMLPLFERAQAEPGITAWVALNDAVALAAHRFLTARDIPVPERLSLIGFDDSLEALGHGLASYDFNIPALAGAVIEHLLAWPRYGRRRPPATVEIPGRIVQRHSLAACSPRRRNQSRSNRRKLGT